MKFAPPGESQYQLCHLSILVERFPSDPPAFPSWEGLFSPFALYFLISSFISLKKFFHHGMEMILIPPSGASSFLAWSQRDMGLSLWVVQDPEGSTFPGIPTACNGWIQSQPCLYSDYPALGFDSGSCYWRTVLVIQLHPGFITRACSSWDSCHFPMRPRLYMHLTPVIHDPVILVTHPWLCHPWIHIHD